MTTANLPNVTVPPADRSPRPWRERVNWRMLAFLAIVGAPFAFLLYTFLSPPIRYHGDYAEVDLRALGNFPFNQEKGTIDDVPKQFRELDGKRVVLRGFMFGNTAGSRGDEFQFVYDVNKCCFGGPPQVQERVFAHAPKGRDVEVYSMYEFAEVTGILHVRVQRDRDTGTVTSVFDMEVEKARKL